MKMHRGRARSHFCPGSLRGVNPGLLLFGVIVAYHSQRSMVSMVPAPEVQHFVYAVCAHLDCVCMERVALNTRYSWTVVNHN